MALKTFKPYTKSTRGTILSSRPPELLIKKITGNFAGAEIPDCLLPPK